MAKLSFYKYLPFSKLTIFFGILIVISSSFTRQLMNFAKANIGDRGFKWLVVLVLLGFGLSFLIIVIYNGFCRERARPFPTLVIIAITIIGLSLTWQIEIAEEKIHLLEFAVLGWLALKDTWNKSKRFKGITIALIFTLAIGILDEGFQAILPYRYFQSWDIFLNCLGGLWGLVLFLVFKSAK